MSASTNEATNNKTCACGNDAAAYVHSFALNMRLDDGVERCMPCQLVRRAHAYRAFVIIITVVIAIGGVLSGEIYALFALLGGPLVWALSTPYLRSAESERGPHAR